MVARSCMFYTNCILIFYLSQGSNLGSGFSDCCWCW